MYAGNGCPTYQPDAKNLNNGVDTPMERRNLGTKLLNAIQIAKHLLHRKNVAISLRDQLAYGPFLVQMVVTRRCNLECGYCDEFDNTSEPVARDVLVQRLKKIRSLGALGIEFTGGEPLLHPDLVDLVDYATKLHFPARMLISNVTLMKDDKIKALNKVGLTHLQVSVDGVTSNDVTKKTLHTLRKRLLEIAELAEFKVVMSGVMGTCPPQETIEMIEFAWECGFIPRVLLIHDHDGQLKLNGDQLKAYERVKRHIGIRFKESLGYRDKLIKGQKSPFKCRAGARYIYIDKDGDAHWCSQKTKLFSRPILEYDIDDLKTQFHTRKGCDGLCTIGCARTSSSHDEFRSQLHS